MRRRDTSSEDGQAMVEFGLTILIFFMLTVGLIDVGRAFWAYNAVASAARFGARWGAVQGGSCASVPYETAPDWCNAQGGSTNFFWGQYGNYPLAADGSCPSGYSAGSSSYYTLSSSSASNTTIVGSIRSHMDSNSSSWSLNAGAWTAGLDRNRTYVCVSLPTTNGEYASGRPVSVNQAPWMPAQGSVITVYVYSSFQPAGGLFGKLLTINMAASSRYVME